MKINIKELILSFLLVVVAPILFILVINIGIFISGKSSDKIIEKATEQTERDKASSTVPEEKKKEQNIPSADENKEKTSDSNSKDNNSDSNANKNSDSEKQNDKNSPIVAGSEYTVKAGDTIMSISARSYGDSNAGDGVEKIKKENDLKNDNLSVGQVLKIPK